MLTCMYKCPAFKKKKKGASVVLFTTSCLGVMFSHMKEYNQIQDTYTAGYRGTNWPQFLLQSDIYCKPAPPPQKKRGEKVPQKLNTGYQINGNFMKPRLLPTDRCPGESAILTEVLQGKTASANPGPFFNDRKVQQ